MFAGLQVSASSVTCVRCALLSFLTAHTWYDFYVQARLAARDAEENRTKKKGDSKSTVESLV